MQQMSYMHQNFTEQLMEVTICNWNKCLETGHSSAAVTVYAFDDSSVAVVHPEKARSLYFQVWKAGSPYMQHQERILSQGGHPL